MRCPVLHRHRADTFATKLVGGFILLGKKGVTLFGTFYSPYANATQNRDIQYYWTLAKAAALNASGHSLALCCTYAITFFALPLLLIVAARELESGKDAGGHLARALCVIPIIAAIIYVMAAGLKPFDAISSIAPELYGLVAQPIMLYGAGCISILSLLAWIRSRRDGAKAYLFVFVPFAVLCSGLIVNKDLRYRMKPDVFDQAGVFTRTYLDHEQLLRTLIVGTDSDVAGLFRVLYYFDLPNTDYDRLDGPNSSIKLIPRDAAFDIQKLPETKKWVLVIGEHPLSGGTENAIHGKGYTLYQIK